MSTPQTPAVCTPFSLPPKEVWRWYAWTRMRLTEPMRWIATCWKGETKELAEQKKEQALMEDATLTLVCERTTFQGDSPAPFGVWQPVETAPNCAVWILGYSKRHGQFTGMLWPGKNRRYMNGGSGVRYFYPTHWMPLPPPPQD